MHKKLCIRFFILYPETIPWYYVMCMEREVTMKFYKVEITFEEGALNTEDKSNIRRRREANEIIDMAAGSIKKWGTLFASELCDSSFVCGLGLKEDDKLKDVTNILHTKLSIKPEIIMTHEITFGDMADMLLCASRSALINEYSVTRDLRILELFTEWKASQGSYHESMIKTISKSNAMKMVEELPFGNGLLEEVERIYYGEPKDKWFGHPVRYIIESRDYEVSEVVMELLAGALYANNRVKNPKYGSLYIGEKEFSRNMIESIYEINKGNVLFMELDSDDFDCESDVCGGSLDFLSNICSMSQKHSDNVLTVFIVSGCNITRIVEKIYDLTEHGALIDIKEEGLEFDDAMKYLKKKAKKKSVRIDKNLRAFLKNDKKYYTRELNDFFDEWFDDKLRTSIYPQYSDVASIKKSTASKEPKGKAYDELSKMIGLKDAKRIVTDAINVHKAHKIYALKGMKSNAMAMHMVFTGNPGTAKTTVARLFAKVLQENDIIEYDSIIEVGRGDLVGKYVGWTAPLVRKKFRQAKGGILFIDEAYSLVDDRDGSYGDEAINTIVQEMENHREDVIVIFAGYPDKMEQFLDKNPGLRSRIAFHVKFEDYSPDELCDIARLMVAQKEMRISEEAMAKVHSIMEQAVKQNDFGNGRFVRNIIERAQMAQATRLVKADFDSISAEDVATICAEDIIPSDYIPKTKNVIGFAL